MPVAPIPRLILCVERTTGSECIASWELVSDGGVDVTPGVAGIQDAIAWATTYDPQEGPAVPMAITSPLFFGVDNVQAGTTTRYMPNGYSVAAAPANPLQYRIPKAGTLRDLRVRHNNPQGNGNPIVYTVRVNGVATAIVVSLASTGVDGSDLANSAAVAVGDLIDIEVTKAASVGSSPQEITATLLLDI